MTPPLRVALVGSGSMGLNHARVIATSPRTTLATVVDPVEANGKAAAERFDAEWTPSLDGLGKVDAVVIAATTEHHYLLAKQVLDLGLPLLIEKPVCPSLAQTEEILDLARTKGQPFMCGLLERFNPAVVVALKMLEAPLNVRAERHSPYAARIKTGVAWDLLVHDVDLVVQVFGGVDPVHAHVEVGHFHPESLPQAEDVVEASLRFDTGGFATVSASRIGQRKVRQLVIQELDRLIEVDLLRRGVTAYRHSTIEGDADTAGFRQFTEMEVPEIVGAEPLLGQLNHFVDLIEGRGDIDRERESVLPAHRVIDSIIAR